MTLDRINVGFLPDDGTGDPERAAFQATNEAIDALDSHLRDNANPHAVTAAQVDAYSKAEVDTRIQDFLTQVAAGTISPAQLAQAVAGITIGASNTSITFAVGEAHSLFLTPETRSAFKPGTFSALSRVSTAATYGVIQASSYNALTGELAFTVISAFGGPGPFNDWQIASLAASTLTQVGLTGQAQASQAAADASRIEARDWATKTSGEVVTGLGFGAKKYATDASGSATAAGYSASLSQAWATQASGEVATGQGYSAKFYAGLAQAAAQAAGGIQPSGSFVVGRLLAAGNTGGTSATDSGVTGLEALLPVQTTTGASKAYAAADLYAETRRSNAGAALADTLPSASVMANFPTGSTLRINNSDTAGGILTLSPGSGTTISLHGGTVASVTIEGGRSTAWLYDKPNTTWRPTGNSLSGLLAANALAEIAALGTTAQATARTNIGAVSAAQAAAAAAPITGARAISAADTIITSDKGKALNLSGTFTLGATAAATLGSGFYCYLRKRDGSGTVTFDPNAAETIDGAATINVYQEAFLIWTDGVSWFSQGRPKGWVSVGAVALTGQSLSALLVTDGFADPEAFEVEFAFENYASTAVITLRVVKSGSPIATSTYFPVAIQYAAGVAGSSNTGGQSGVGINNNTSSSALPTSGNIRLRNIKSAVSRNQSVEHQVLDQNGLFFTTGMFSESTAATITGIQMSGGTISSVTYRTRIYRP